MSIVHKPSSLPERITAASRRPSNLGAPPGDAVSLAMGEPDGGSPAAVVAAAKAALDHGRTNYSPLTGTRQLRDAIASWVHTTTGRSTSYEEVVPTHGGAAGLAATILALVQPGDKVLLPEPTYSLYADQLAMANAEVIWVPNRADGSLDLERLAELAPEARMVIVCSPANPTGGVLTPEEMTGLADLLTANPRLLLLSDEAYGDIVFDGQPFTSALTLDSVADQVIMVGTFSKSFAMTGWRVGYAIATRDNADKIGLVHRTFNGALNTFVQDACVEALKTDPEVLAEQTRRYQRRRDMVMAELSRMPGVSVLPPAGAFYAFPKIDSDLTSTELVARFAEGGVLLRAGSEFGPSGEGHVRLSFATDDESLAEGLRRFRAVVDSLPTTENGSAK